MILATAPTQKLSKHDVFWLVINPDSWVQGESVQETVAVSEAMAFREFETVRLLAGLHSWPDFGVSFSQKVRHSVFWYLELYTESVSLVNFAMVPEPREVRQSLKKEQNSQRKRAECD